MRYSREERDGHSSSCCASVALSLLRFSASPSWFHSVTGMCAGTGMNEMSELTSGRSRKVWHSGGYGARTVRLHWRKLVDDAYRWQRWVGYSPRSDSAHCEYSCALIDGSRLPQAAPLQADGHTRPVRTLTAWPLQLGLLWQQSTRGKYGIALGAKRRFIYSYSTAAVK